MKLGSLCSGFGGLDLAVEAHYGATTVWHAETDKNCAKVLAHHWPAVPNHGDLTLVDWSQVEPVDMVCAGFPCQPFSVSGRKRGADDERAIFPFIADAVGFLQPSVVVLENVAAIVGFPHGRGGGLDVVAALTELGFDNIRWGVVRASDAGAPHRRARWFCIAALTDADRRQREGIGDTTGLGRRPHGRAPTYSGSERHGERQDARRVGLLDRRDESQTRQQQRPRPEPVDRGAAAPTDTGSVGRKPRPGQLPATRRRKTPERPAGDVEPRGGDPTYDWGQYDLAITRWERTLGRPAPAPLLDGQLSSRFVEWMMGLPDGHVCGLGLSRTAELKALGNGVVPLQAALGLEILDDQR